MPLDQATDLRLGQRSGVTALTVPRYDTLPDNAFDGQLALLNSTGLLYVFFAESDDWVSISGGSGDGGVAVDFEEWYAGVEEVPSADLGEPGDYYLNSQGDVLEKQLSGWVFLFNFRTGGYEFTQTTPAATWTITHNQGRRPIPAIVQGNELVYADVTYPDANTVSIAFPSPTAGSAYL